MKFSRLVSLFFAAAISSVANAQTVGLRDSLLYRSGMMQTSSVGALSRVDTTFLYGSFEYNRTFLPRADFRLGARLTTNFDLNRMQVQETFVGGRYYPLTMATNFTGPVGGYSIDWTFIAKPYVETQVAVGHYIADAIGDPPLFDLASSYLGMGGGAGCKFSILSNLSADLGLNYQRGVSFGAVILDPSLLHVYLGVATAF